ncbi:polyisoprenoid-binding protein YceI [Litorimonas taeanensis]|uniref:Polyisoprenoid-binding protein YceI n=1 Tax=Litorimonas taeanensis TaxID=568099 RepID=A0A420WCW6_9PROT|nr:YceI family protein [Litorimonas taeanensis]RKQ68823.1 polyisoprenoid-binding protein YceI [Litorimonas taeanensis]
MKLGNINRQISSLSKLAVTGTALTVLIGCSQAEQQAEAFADQVQETATSASEATKDAVTAAKTKASEVTTDIASKIDKPGADLEALPSGTYTSDQGHAYVAFSYSHQGYSKPILRWGETNATVIFDNDNPENSALTVTIPVESIDSGVAAFDDHLKSADFFEAEAFPEITFESTEINHVLMGSGSVTGDMTIKGVTKPVVFSGRVNKVGKDSRSQVDMFGISATASLKRSDFNVGKYVPHVGDDVEITVEVEFKKAD